MVAYFFDLMIIIIVRCDIQTCMKDEIHFQYFNSNRNEEDYIYDRGINICILVQRFYNSLFLIMNCALSKLHVLSISN